MILVYEGDDIMDYVLDGNFPYLNTKLQKLIPIIEKYKFEAVAKAIFTINSWRDNRSAQENCLALNAALVKYNALGECDIKSYSEFISFFKSVEPILKISDMDDCVLNDFGEIKLCYKNSFYPVITGTGHAGAVFSALHFLEELSNEMRVNQQVLKFLEYERELIDLLQNANVSAYEYLPIVFDLPSKDYYDAVQNLWRNSPWKDLDPTSIDFFSDEERSIERRHFIKQKQVIYPLFNPSLMLDVYTSLLEHASLSIIKKHIRQTFVNIIRKIYIGKNSKNFIVGNYKLCEGEKVCPLSIPGFLLALRDKIVFFIDTHDIGIESANMFIEQIEYWHNANILGIVDLDSYVGSNKFRGISIPADQNIDYIFFNDYTDLNKCHLTFGARNEKVVYTAIDLMYMLLFSDNINQVLQFNDFPRNSEEKIYTLGGVADYFTFWKQEAGCIAKGAIEFGTIYAECETAASYVYDKYVCLKKCFPFHICNLPMGIPEEWNISIDDNGVYQFIKKTDEMLGGALFQFKNKCVFWMSYDYLSIFSHERVQEIQQYRDFISGIIERFLIQYGKILSKINYISEKFIQLHCESLTASLEKEQYIEITKEKSISQEICITYIVDSDKVMIDISECVNRSVEYKLILQLLRPLVERDTVDFGFLLTELDKNRLLKKTANARVEKLDYYYNTNSLKVQLSEKAEVLVRKEIAKVALVNGVIPGEYMQKEATEAVRKMQNSLVIYFENMLLKYDRINLHKDLLTLYSVELFLGHMNLAGYNLSDEIEELEKENSKKKSFYLRERNKNIQDALEYLMETNLYLDTERGTENINNFEMEKIIALAKWLVILQNNSDLCYHTDSKTKLIILDDYQVNVELGKEYSDKHNSVSPAKKCQ